MAISFNTGATANSGSSQATSQAITIPAGVLAGDVVFVGANWLGVSGTTPATLSAASTGTAPSSLGAAITGSEPLPAATTGQVFWFVAGASDAGKVVTITGTLTGFWALAIVAYTGAGSSQPDTGVYGTAFGGANTASVTLPTKATATTGDWGVFFGGGAFEGGFGAGPAGQTQREVAISSVDVVAAFFDSNGSVGSSGTNIGGGTYSTATAANSIIVGITIGLAPPGGGGFNGTASTTVTATITAAGTVATSSGASATFTATRAAAGTVATSSGASGTFTAGITAAGNVATASGASLAVTATMTAAGTVATASGAALTATATIAATGTVAGIASGAALAAAAALTAAGTVATASGAVLAVTAALTAVGPHVQPEQGTVTVTSTLAGTVTVTSTLAATAAVTSQLAATVTIESDL